MSFDPQKIAATPRQNGKRPRPATNDATVTITLPIGDPGGGYTSPRVDFTGTPRQAAAAKMLARVLLDRGERYAGGTSAHVDGTVVENVNGAVRWLLDRVADAFEAETGKQLVHDYDLIFR